MIGGGKGNRESPSREFAVSQLGVFLAGDRMGRGRFLTSGIGYIPGAACGAVRAYEKGLNAIWRGGILCLLVIR